MPEVEKVVLSVDIHCQACKAKVRKCLAGFPGLESIEFNMEERKVSMKGKLDPRRVYKAVKRKSGKRTVLLFPLPQIYNKAEEQKKLIEPEQEAEESVVLKVKMHCEACVREVTRTIQKMKDVYEVKVDSFEEKVIVRGRNLNPKNICDRVRRKTHKILNYLPTPPLEEEEKEEAKKVEESSTKEAENKKGMENKVEDNKEDEKKDLEEKEGDAKAEGMQRPRQENTMVEEKLVNANSEEEIVIEMKKCGYTPFQSISGYTTYPPQLFSDENPNACCIM